MYRLQGRARQPGLSLSLWTQGCCKCSCARLCGCGPLSASQSPSILTRRYSAVGEGCCPCERAGFEGPLRESILTFNKHYANCMQITTHSLRQMDNLSVFRNNNVGPVPWSPSRRAFLSLPSLPPSFPIFDLRPPIPEVDVKHPNWLPAPCFPDQRTKARGPRATVWKACTSPQQPRGAVGSKVRLLSMGHPQAHPVLCVWRSP